MFGHVDAERVALAVVGERAGTESMGGKDIDASVAVETVCGKSVARSSVARALADVGIGQGEDVECLEEGIEGDLEVWWVWRVILR